MIQTISFLLALTLAIHLSIMSGYRIPFLVTPSEESPEMDIEQENEEMPPTKQ